MWCEENEKRYWELVKMFGQETADKMERERNERLIEAYHKAEAEREAKRNAKRK